MSTQGQGQAITFAPACIGTSIVDAEFKLGYLRKELEDKSIYCQRQRKNIEFLIHYYENGGKVPPPGQTMWLLDGKVVDKMPEKIPEGSAMWAEEVCLPLTLTCSITLYLPILRLCVIKSRNGRCEIIFTSQLLQEMRISSLRRRKMAIQPNFLLCRLSCGCNTALVRHRLGRLMVLLLLL
jgi:hypothetical protein